MTTQQKTNPATLSPDATKDNDCNVCEQLKDEHERRVDLERIVGQDWNADEQERRVDLERIFGQVWNTAELKSDFIVIGFQAPLIAVRRKDNQEEGTLRYLHHPRLYVCYRSCSRD